MNATIEDTLRGRVNPENYAKLEELGNEHVLEFVARYVEHCNPSTVFVCDGSAGDIDYIRNATLDRGEEVGLSTEGHTIHFDNYDDQARDKNNSKILIPPGVEVSKNINTLDRQEGLDEIHRIMKDIMEGREMVVLFGCLGPNNSEFSIPSLQLSDSAYVAHNEIILFRQGYEEFKRLEGSANFFKFVHSQGELDGAVSKNLDERRIYIDLEGETVYSANNQYGGNSLGFKKHAMRLAIQKASRDGNWLCEHMFIMGVHGPSDRVTYFAGAYPSACGKTSTAMIPGESIVGDDIAYFRVSEGQAMVANVEQGMFGIIGGVNEQGDPVIFKALTSPGEAIFSNVLKTEDNVARWEGDGLGDYPAGVNHSGEWEMGKTKADGSEEPPSHKNARYTIPISGLENRDVLADDPKGVPVGGIIYGGRDSDTCVPVNQAYDVIEGVSLGASLESESTFATLDKAGTRSFSPMSNIDFLSIPLGRYIQDNLNFFGGGEEPPKFFTVNYFLRKDGEFLNAISDKRVWLKWMELRVNGEVDAVKSPTGFIPKYEDLEKLFKDVLDKQYSQEDYEEQFKIRIPELLAKFERIDEIYAKVPNPPAELMEAFKKMKERTLALQEEHGDYVNPSSL